MDEDDTSYEEESNHSSSNTDNANNKDENPNDYESDTDMVETSAQISVSNSPPRLSKHICFALASS